MIGSMDEPLHLGPASLDCGDVETAIGRAKIVGDYLRGFRRTIQAVSFDFNGVVVVVRETDRVEWVVDRYRAAKSPRALVPARDLEDGFDKTFYIGRHRAEGPTLVGE